MGPPTFLAQQAARPVVLAGSHTTKGFAFTVVVTVLAALGNSMSLVATSPDLSDDFKQNLIIFGNVLGIVMTSLCSVAGLATPPPTAVGGQGVAGGSAAPDTSSLLGTE